MDTILLNETFFTPYWIFFNKTYSIMHVRFLISHISLVKLLPQIIHDPLWRVQARL